MIRENVPLSETTADLEAVARDYAAAAANVTRRVVICAGTGCMAGGALKVYQSFVEKIAAAGLAVVTAAHGRKTATIRTPACTCPRAAARAFAKWARW